MFKDARVFVARSEPNYAEVPTGPFQELIPGARISRALITLRQLLAESGWDASNQGRVGWNPLGSHFGNGKTIVIKPNWVHHENASGQGLDCLITHSSVIEAVVEYSALSRPRRILVGDAPIQACDLETLKRNSGLLEALEGLRRRGIPVEFRDFRLHTKSRGPWGRHQGTGRSELDYVRFNLGKRSLLEPITHPNSRFRVTMYDPAALEQTHSHSNHQYRHQSSKVEDTQEDWHYRNPQKSGRGQRAQELPSTPSKRQRRGGWGLL